MFRTTVGSRVVLIAVVLIAVGAPQALAKPPKGGKAKVVNVQGVKKVSAIGNESTVLRSALSAAYSQGCQNGTLPDRTMGSDNNNYEYFGDVCTVPLTTASSLVARSGSDQTDARSTPGPAVDDNTTYEYYGTAAGR